MTAFTGIFMNSYDKVSGVTAADAVRICRDLTSVVRTFWVGGVIVDNGVMTVGTFKRRFVLVTNCAAGKLDWRISFAVAGEAFILTVNTP